MRTKEGAPVMYSPRYWAVVVCINHHDLVTMKRYEMVRGRDEYEAVANALRRAETEHGGVEGWVMDSCEEMV
jgi:hypothetical protein